ncbi:MAG: hypothetical protein JSS43_05940 [Proteobacteria bacterium]|nr:hypothetical protein [Pseudomonadota bacterium]
MPDRPAAGVAYLNTDGACVRHDGASQPGYRMRHAIGSSPSFILTWW